MGCPLSTTICSSDKIWGNSEKLTNSGRKSFWDTEFSLFRNVITILWNKCHENGDKISGKCPSDTSLQKEVRHKKNSSPIRVLYIYVQHVHYTLTVYCNILVYPHCCASLGIGGIKFIPFNTNWSLCKFWWGIAEFA